MNDVGDKLLYDGLSLFSNRFVYGSGVLFVLIGGEICGMEKSDIGDDGGARNRIVVWYVQWLVMEVDLVVLNAMAAWFIPKEAVCGIVHFQREEGSEDCTGVLVSKEATPKIMAPLTNGKEW